MTIKLTELQVRNAKGREAKYSMSAGQGLALVVMPDDSKYWRLRYGFGGKQRMIAVGKAPTQSEMRQYEMCMRLALKAQSQCRATLETLACIKNPTAPTFVKQANIANGPQQVNNCAEGTQAFPSSARAHAHGKTQNAPNELLGVTHEQGQRLDASTTQGAIRAHSTMATVAAVHRPEDGRGKGCR